MTWFLEHIANDFVFTDLLTCWVTVLLPDDQCDPTTHVTSLMTVSSSYSMRALKARKNHMRCGVTLVFRQCKVK